MTRLQSQIAGFLVLAGIFAVIPNASAASFRCDGGVLSAKDGADQTTYNIDSKRMANEYDRLYEEQEALIKKLANNQRMNESDARKAFFVTAKSKETQAALQKQREAMRYDAISRYMFDDEDLNDEPEHYTKVIHKGSNERFYIFRNIVIARAVIGANGEITITRYDEKCGIRRTAVLKSLNHRTDDLLISDVKGTPRVRLAPKIEKAPAQ